MKKEENKITERIALHNLSFDELDLKTYSEKLLNNIEFPEKTLKQIKSQIKHLKKVMNHRGEPHFNHHDLDLKKHKDDPDFQNYKKIADMVQGYLKDPNYEVLKATDLEDKLPLALCLLASVKAGFAENREKVLRRHLGNMTLKEVEKFDGKGLFFDSAEKLTVKSIEACTNKVIEKIQENNYNDYIVGMVDKLIEIYVHYEDLQQYVWLSGQDVYKRIRDFEWNEVRNVVRHSQDILHLHLGVKFISGHYMLRDIIELLTKKSVVEKIETPKSESVDL